MRFLDLGGLAGGILAGGLYFAAAGEHPDQRMATGALAAGITGGLLLAWHLTSEMELDYPRDGHPDGHPATSWLDKVTPTVSPSASNGRGVDGAVAGMVGAF